MATILVLDDEELVARVIEVSLRKEGHDILAARTGAEARDIAEHRQEPIDLVIANYTLRDAKGIEVIRQLVLSHPEMKVLRISGRPLEMLRAHGDISDRAAFLPKPFTPKRLVQVVDRVLRSDRHRIAD
jgi:DNA-binding response OmpR family regulator